MKNTKNTSPNKDETAAGPNHTERIKSEVLAKIGKPPRLDRLEISRHHNGKYRVNIWERTEPDKSIAITSGAHIGLSYYLTVSDTGEILNSNPPMTKLGSSV